MKKEGNIMLQQQAFSGKNKMLKGGLHTHTTRSDGKLTPEEVIKLFKKAGYDFLALTDHRKYNFKDFAPEEGLTIIPGMEFDNGRITGPDEGFRTYHTVCIGVPKEDGNGYEQDEEIPRPVAPTQETYQPYLDEIKSKKNLIMYCHPEWSATPAYLFEKLEGYFAMEIWNSGCAIENDMDTDAAYWDELLGKGKRIWGAATDDGHQEYHHAKGWVMVNAENNINSILKALEEGAFYSSCGPEIFDFYVDEENQKIVVECSPAAKIRLHSDGHPTTIKRSKEGEITRAEFNLKSWCGPYNYVRVSVIDKDGKYAWSNPIFL